MTEDKIIARAYKPLVDDMTDELAKTLIGKPVLIDSDPDQKVGEVIDAWIDDDKIQYEFTIDKKLVQGNGIYFQPEVKDGKN